MATFELSEYILSYLTTHEWDDAVKFFNLGEDENSFPIEQDLDGRIILETTPNAEKLTVTVSDGSTSTSPQWTSNISGSELFERCCIN